MREILFRGKRIDNGEWVYGVPVIGITSGVFMVWIESEAKRGRGELSLRDVVRQAEIIPETVGQYTGLNDKNGVKIFEGDILKDSLGWVCLVKWDDSNGRFLGYHKKPRGDTYVCYVGREPAQEIIGNIHDNPELMGETK